MFQTCPVCNGTGLVSRPPWIAGDQPYWMDTSSAPYPCKVCNGIGILHIEKNYKSCLQGDDEDDKTPNKT